MAVVDPDDDSLRRFVALHHRYDEQRREWRDVELEVFDDARVFQAFLDGRNAELLARQATGDADPREHVSGVVREPGHRARHQSERLRRRALEHGARPPYWDRPDVRAVVTAGDPDQPA